MTLAAILKTKGKDVVSVSPTSTIAEVVKVLSARRIGGVVVLDAASQLLGIFTERDIVHALAAHGARALEMTSAQLMTRNIITATPETTVNGAMALMSQGRFRHLPVMDNGRLVGLVSIGDVVKSRIQQQEADVDSLKAYVAGAA
jgi:CBS domain-containing protein